MRTVLFLLFPVIIYFIISISCGPRNPSQSQKLLGKWKIESVFESGEDVSSEHNPSKDRWIKFHTNHRFDSDGEPYGKNSGNWSINENNVLFLDSDVGDDDDSYWQLDFTEKAMTWQGVTNEFAKNFKINFIKD